MTKKYYRYIFIFAFIIFLLTVAHIISNRGLNYQFETDKNVELSSLQSNLKLKQHLLKALRYTRNNNAREEILKSLSIISKVVNIGRNEIISKKMTEKRNKSGLQDVCMEKYLGRIDHPLYNKGQGEYECQKKAFKDVLTFLIMVENCNEMETILKGVRQNYSDSKVVFGTSSNLNCTKDKDVLIKVAKSSVADIVQLLTDVKTDYVFVAANNLYHFDNQSHIERLVQMVSYGDVPVAAGGVRLEDGRFETGCYQMAMKMYTLKIVPGYDMSFNSCLYCDYSPAPFVTKTSFLLNQLSKMRSRTPLNGGLTALQIFSSFMINNGPQMMVCPDVLFHMKPYHLSLHHRKDWFSFVEFFQLNRIVLDEMAIGGDRFVLNFTCKEAEMTCRKEKGIIVPLCCLQELSDSLKFMNRLLQSQNVTFEVLEGTVMGGLKFNNILLWERDADTNYRVQDIDRMEAKLDVLKKQGYTMGLTYECPHKRDHEKCRLDGWHGSIYYAFRTPHWRTEMYGVTFILSDFRGNLKKPTKILIDGEWYLTYTNPVLYARNIYGGDPFQHVEHAATLGTSDAKYVDLYDGEFSSCPQPGFHGCLSNFAGEGGLQFQDVYV